MPIQIHTRTGRETYILQILEAWKLVYPEKYQFFKSALADMRKVQKNPDGSFVDGKGRLARISVRMPTELWLFFQQKIPDWGKDYRDVELLLKVAKDFASTEVGVHKRIHSTTDWKARKQKEKRENDANLKRPDSKKRGKVDQGNRGEPQEARLVS